MSNPSAALSFTSPHRGEVGAQRRVRGMVLQRLWRPLTLTLSPEGRGDFTAFVVEDCAEQGSP